MRKGLLHYSRQTMVRQAQGSIQTVMWNTPCHCHPNTEPPQPARPSVEELRQREPNITEQVTPN